MILHYLVNSRKVILKRSWTRLLSISAKICTNTNSNKMNESDLMDRCRHLVPRLSSDKYKGQAGRIGVFGGSLEYTGAPYYASITSLKVGCDLVYVFCMKAAATVIKSYSPELIVLPHLDADEPEKEIEPWLDRLHVIVIGPGLGRDDTTFKTITSVINLCRKHKKPLVIDADGLFFLANNKKIIENYPSKIILTPNAVEFDRLVSPNAVDSKIARARETLKKCSNLTFLCKGQEDLIFDDHTEFRVVGSGSGRRSGGQGDLLSGSVGTFLTWALQKPHDGNGHDDRAALACYAACKLVRKCNELAFKKYGRSMTALDMVHEVHSAFEELFELQ